MANGKRHAQDSMNLAPWVFALTTATFGWMVFEWGVFGALYMGLFACVGCLAGIFFTPDLDMETRTLAERVPVVGFIWFVYWLPYAWLIPHRNWLSHGPIMGTLGRQVYFFGGLWFLMWLSGTDISTWLVSQVYSPLYWSWFVGLCVSDLAHWLRDL